MMRLASSWIRFLFPSVLVLICAFLYSRMLVKISNNNTTSKDPFSPTVIDSNLPPSVLSSGSNESTTPLAESISELHSHCWNGYMASAFPADELKPITCTPRVRDPYDVSNQSTLGNFSLTLIDSLDSLMIFGKISDFIKAVKYISSDLLSLTSNLQVSSFETNIRVLGGLLSGHILATFLSNQLSEFRINSISFHENVNSLHRPVLTNSLSQLSQPFLNFNYKGELLEKAFQLGHQLRQSFTSTLPYSQFNLRYGVQQTNRLSQFISTAEAGTFLMEFGVLSLMTGDESFYQTARNASLHIWNRRSKLDLVGSLWSVTNGSIVDTSSGIGAGIDSFFEYLYKAGILFGDETLLQAFYSASAALRKYCQTNGLYFACDMDTGALTGFPKLNALGAFWPGVLFRSGSITDALKSYSAFLSIWLKYQALPEDFNVLSSEPVEHSRGYPLRPEFFESTFVISQSMGNFSEKLRNDVVLPAFNKLNGTLRTSCGVASQANVADDDDLLDNMESFFISETLVYLYLIAMDNTIINQRLPAPLDDIVFSTEAHMFPNPLLYSEYYVVNSQGVEEVRRRLCRMTQSDCHCDAQLTPTTTMNVTRSVIES